MNPPTETNVVDDESSDASYEPGWYAVLRGPVVAASYSSPGEDSTRAMGDADDTPARGLFKRHARRRVGV